MRPPSWWVRAASIAPAAPPRPPSPETAAFRAMIKSAHLRPALGGVLLLLPGAAPGVGSGAGLRVLRTWSAARGRRVTCDACPQRWPSVQRPSLLGSSPPCRPGPGGALASGAPGSVGEPDRVIRSGARLSWPRAPARPDSDARGPTLTGRVPSKLAVAGSPFRAPTAPRQDPGSRPPARPAIVASRPLPGAPRLVCRRRESGRRPGRARESAALPRPTTAVVPAPPGVLRPSSARDACFKFSGQARPGPPRSESRELRVGRAALVVRRDEEPKLLRSAGPRFRAHILW